VARSLRISSALAVLHVRSDLCHWRERIGGKLELLLAEILRVAHENGALRVRDVERVTVDTTVQPKAITFPNRRQTVARGHWGIETPAHKRGVRLRQSYLRIAELAAVMAGHYAHAKQYSR
jgi:IS5 family transposase